MLLSFSSPPFPLRFACAIFSLDIFASSLIRLPSHSPLPYFYYFRKYLLTKSNTSIKKFLNFRPRRVSKFSPSPLPALAKTLHSWCVSVTFTPHALPTKSSLLFHPLSQSRARPFQAPRPPSAHRSRSSAFLTGCRPRLKLPLTLSWLRSPR